MHVQYVSMISCVFWSGSDLVAVAHRSENNRNLLSMACYINPEIFTVIRSRSNTFRPVRAGTKPLENL